jgi:hypothetical protein
VIQFRYVGYQLWESSVKGFFSKYNQDFIILSKEGMNFIRLDEAQKRRSIQRKNQVMKMVHSLCSMDYLKVEDGNMIYFEQKVDDSKVIKIQQCSQNNQGNFKYEDVYHIKLEVMDLHDLIFIQGMFLLDSVGDII